MSFPLHGFNVNELTIWVKCTFPLLIIIIKGKLECLSHSHSPYTVYMACHTHRHVPVCTGAYTGTYHKYIHMYTQSHTQTCTQSHTHTHHAWICTIMHRHAQHTKTRKYTHTSVHRCTHKSTYKCAHTCFYEFMHVHTCAYMCMHAHMTACTLPNTKCTNRETNVDTCTQTD